MLKRISFVTCLLLASTALQAEDTHSSNQEGSYPLTLNIDKLMTEKELTETGMNRLNKRQKKALDEWLTGYTLHLVTKDVQQDQTSEQTGQKTSTSALATSNNAIQGTYESGQYIHLQNGSVYKIVSYDQFKSKTWPPGSEVQEGKSKDVFYPLTLTNTTNGQRVIAKKLSKAEAKPYSDSYKVKKINDTDGIITLSNGKHYGIAPSDKVLIQDWASDQPIVAKPTNISTFPIILMNGQTGRSIYVKELTPGQIQELQQQKGQHETTSASSQTQS